MKYFLIIGILLITFAANAKSDDSTSLHWSEIWIYTVKNVETHMTQSNFYEFVWSGTSEAETMIGLNNKEVMEGNEGNDRLEGNGGADAILGGRGGDYIVGGSGDDILVGGEGEDIFYFDIALGFGHDQVGMTGDIFMPGEDKLEFSSEYSEDNLRFSWVYAGIPATIGLLKITAYRNDSRGAPKFDDMAGTIVLVSFPFLSLTSENFLFTSSVELEL